MEVQCEGANYSCKTILFKQILVAFTGCIHWLPSRPCHHYSQCKADVDALNAWHVNRHPFCAQSPSMLRHNMWIDLSNVCMKTAQQQHISIIIHRGQKPAKKNANKSVPCQLAPVRFILSSSYCEVHADMLRKWNMMNDTASPPIQGTATYKWGPNSNLSLCENHSVAGC